jgi:hypothetical protein
MTPLARKRAAVITMLSLYLPLWTISLCFAAMPTTAFGQSVTRTSKKASTSRQRRSARRRRLGKSALAARAPALLGGVIENKSKRTVWITADNKKYCLKPGESSKDLNIEDADGLLLDGDTPMLFDSSKTELGGGKVFRAGAIKVCDPGRLTVEDGLLPAYALKVTISAPGFICGSDPAGYKTSEWCKQTPGWDFQNTPVARPCP